MFNIDLINDINLFKKFLAFKILSETSINSYVSDLEKSFQYIQKNKKIEKLSKNDIESCAIDDWRQLFFELQKNNLSAKTQERYLMSLKNYAKFKKKSQNIELSIEKFKNFKLKITNEIMQFSKADIKNFLNCFNDIKDINTQRNQTLVYLLYSVGLRINEALNLRKQDLFDKYIKIQGKGNKIRMVPLFPKIKKMLKDYIAKTNNDNIEYIFLNNTGKNKWHACAVARLFRETCLINNLKIIHPHILRHACATHLLESKCNLRSIQALLGHTSLEITKRYINFSNEDLKTSFFKIEL